MSLNLYGGEIAKFCSMTLLIFFAYFYRFKFFSIKNQIFTQHTKKSPHHIHFDAHAN
jgi:hypothetical protein